MVFIGGVIYLLFIDIINSIILKKWFKVFILCVIIFF